MTTHAATALHAHLLRVASHLEAIDAAIPTIQQFAGTPLCDLGDDERSTIEAARCTLELPALTDEDADPAEDFDTIDLHHHVLGDPIEVKATGYFTAGRWHVNGALAIVSTGGPHIELAYDGTRLRLDGWHSGAHITDIPVTSSRAASALEAIWESAEAG